MQTIARLLVFAPDACVLAGFALAGIGVYRLWPACIWFYAGAVCVLVGVALSRAEGR